MSPLNIKSSIREKANYKESGGDKSKLSVITLENIGVKYRIGGNRDNIKSRFIKLFSPKGQDTFFWGLKGVNFTGFTGDILGVIGANGAGKSTLCKVIARVLKPDTGKIVVNGKVSALLSLGTGFNPQLSGKENIYLNGMMLGFSRKNIDDIFPAIVEFSGLGHFIGEPLKNYSSGMKARIAFSVGAMIEPEILILDEALSAGDLEFSERAGKKLQQIIGRSKIVIVVTHNLHFVEKYCTAALWIDKGTLIKTGLPHDVVTDYRDSTKKNKHIPQRKINFTKPSVKIGDSKVVKVRNLGLCFSLQKQTNLVNRKLFKPDNKKLLGGEIWPLRDINFSVKQGEVIGIIGRNGEGKTTLCRILSGILKPDRGEVFVDGKTTALLTFGAGFNIHLSGYDNIFLNGMMLGIPKKKLMQMYPDIVSFSGLEKFISHPVKKYSSGMRSRLAFSIAAMIQPDIFIVDEALNAGDIYFAEKASQKIQELMEKAKAVIVVTHSMGFVKKVCTRALWLDNGVIKFDGPPEETVAKYVSAARQTRLKP